jgi:ferredoxin--NADP+ reductase
MGQMRNILQYPDVAMNLVRPKQPVTGTVVANDLCMRGKSASFVKHTVIDVAGTPLAGTFRPGQSFGVIPPGKDEKGRPHKVRLYSIACPTWGEDGAGMHISTTPKRLIDEYRSDTDPSRHELFLGVCSNYLCDLRVGDKVALSGPQGKRFLLPIHVNAHDYLFVATGTGIAPFRGMLMELLSASDGPCTSRIELVMGVPYTTDLLYDDEFQALAKAHPNFSYHTAISREADGIYVTTLLARQMDYFSSMLRADRTLVYLCGLRGMEQDLYRMLQEHDLADDFVQQSSGGLKPTQRCKVEVY